ncbi:hypothetical protein MPLA_1350079 [Mesorhizobium sp. ORS 3359]|nr:hypothetical protein MPLA_1350079 [Mesorhizobium sp. ORS 3359]
MGRKMMPSVQRFFCCHGWLGDPQSLSVDPLSYLTKEKARRRLAAGRRGRTVLSCGTTRSRCQAAFSPPLNLGTKPTW